jgi:hypothetical protein
MGYVVRLASQYLKLSRPWRTVHARKMENRVVLRPHVFWVHTDSRDYSEAAPTDEFCWVLCLQRISRSTNQGCPMI